MKTEIYGNGGESNTTEENMEEFDVIIIGSGVGGLDTAICLARAGKNRRFQLIN